MFNRHYTLKFSITLVFFVGTVISFLALLFDFEYVFLSFLILLVLISFYFLIDKRKRYDKLLFDNEKINKKFKDISSEFDKNTKELSRFKKYNEELFKKSVNFSDMFFKIIDKSNQIVYVKDDQYEYQFVNNMFLKVFDLEKESVIGKTVKIFRKLGYEDREYKRNLEEDKELIHGIRNKIFSHIQFKIGKISKTVFHEKKVVFKYNNRKYILGVINDITREIENQKKYDRLIKNLREKIIEKNKVLDIFDSIIDILDNITVATEEEYEIIIKKIFSISMKLMNKADYGAVFLFNKGIIRYIAAKGYDLDKLNEAKISSESFSKKVESKPRIVINDNKKSIKYFFRDECFEIQKIKESIRIPLINGSEMIGVMSLDIDVNSAKKFDENSINLMHVISKFVHVVTTLIIGSVDSRLYERKMIKALLSMLEMHDEYTNNHSEDVATLARELGLKLELPKKDIERLYWAAITHDIGKIEVPAEILNKKTRLTNEEFEKIKLHPVTGYKALSNLESLKDISKFVLHHHERYDGSGYPDGLKGSEIPFISRILTVVDSWDAMTSERSYRQPLTKKRALYELVDNAGSQFDPFIVKNFVELLQDLEVINESILERKEG